MNADSSLVQATQALADGIDTSQVQVVAYGCTGVPMGNLTVTLSSSKGASDTISPSSTTTNDSGIATFTVVSRDTTNSILTAVANGTTINNTAVINWRATDESGVTSLFGGDTTVTTITDAASGRLPLPQWRKPGLPARPRRRYLNVYVVYDDGAHSDGAQTVTS